MQGWERAFGAVSVRNPSPTIPTYRYEEEKEKTVEGKNEASSLDQSKSILPAHQTRQSHTIEYGVSKIVLQGLSGE